MRKRSLVALLAFLAAGLTACSSSDGLDLDSIERVEDTRDPKSIVGSVWTQGLDCTYGNPPEAWIVKVGSVDCPGYRRNLEVLKSKQRYFIPRGNSRNEPPYCLVDHPADASYIENTESMIRLFCSCEPKPGANRNAKKPLPFCT
jgi:hypothetical protein